MKLPNTKILIIIAGTILVVLIAVTIFVSGLTKESQSPQSQPTLIPTGIFEQGGLFGNGNDSSSQSADRTTRPSNQIDSMSEAIRNNSEAEEGDVFRLETMKETLPVDTANFTFDYSPKLDHFVAAIKTSDGKDKFKQYLVNNGVDDLFTKFPTILTVGNWPISQVIQAADNAFQKENQPPTPPNESSNPDLPSLSFSQLSNLMGSLFTLGQGGDVNKAVDKSNQELGQQTNSSGQSNGQGGGGGTGGGANICGQTADICANPPKLVSQGNVRLSPQAMAALEAARSDARAHGVNIIVGSSYRDCQAQYNACQSICSNGCGGCPGKCAPVGQSCHQYGEAVDLSGDWPRAKPYMLTNGWQQPLPTSDAHHFSLIKGGCPSK